MNGKQEWVFAEVPIKSGAEIPSLLVAVDSAVNGEEIPAWGISRENITNTGAFLLLPFERDIINVGLFQAIDKDVDLEYCKEHDVDVSRRPAGGGIAICFTNCVAGTVAIHKDNPKFPAGLRDRYELFHKAWIAGFKNLGINARWKPLNDSEVEGRKLLASADIPVTDKSVQFQYLLSCSELDLDKAAKAAPLPPEKLADKAARDLAERVTNLNAEAKRGVTLDELKEAVLKGWEEVLDIKFARRYKYGDILEMPPEVANKAKALRAMLSSEDYFWKVSERGKIGEAKGCVKSEFAHKAPAGLIRAAVAVKEGKIENIMIAFDGMATPGSVFDEMENAVKGLKIDDEQSIKGKIKELYERPGSDIPETTLDDFVNTVMGAINKIR
jgi:lipoate-protein ligase A